MIEEKTRSEISDEYKWDLSLMYKNEDEYNSDFEELKTCIEKLKEYKGIITKDAKTLLEFLKLDTKIDVLIANLYVYASLKNDLCWINGFKMLNDNPYVKTQSLGIVTLNNSSQPANA